MCVFVFPLFLCSTINGECIRENTFCSLSNRFSFFRPRNFILLSIYFFEVFTVSVTSLYNTVNSIKVLCVIPAMDKSRMTTYSLVHQQVHEFQRQWRFHRTLTKSVLRWKMNNDTNFIRSNIQMGFSRFDFYYSNERKTNFQRILYTDLPNSWLK